MSYPQEDEPRLVQIGMNIVSLLEVNDKEHFFEANIITHVTWDARPLPNRPYEVFWRPWVQIHNVKAVEEIRNDGMRSFSDKKLTQEIKRQQNGDPNVPVMVMETRNFVGKFASNLDLHNFPFDHQPLMMSLVCNQSKVATFTHKVGREMDRAKDPKRRAKPVYFLNPDGSQV
jgi:hypothetical protein